MASWLAGLFGAATALAAGGIADREDRYYRLETIAVPDGVAFEVSGMAPMPGERLGVALRKGEIWVLDGLSDLGSVGYERFATGLHEPLGLAWRDGAFYCAQRGELTRIADRDGDGTADEYLAVVDSWGVTGSYHEYTYGPVFDREGAAWVTLNCTLGPTIEPDHNAWRGWSLRSALDGDWRPVSGGLRSPCGLGTNAVGDVFATDQQGNWVPTCALVHLREGVFHGHVDSLESAARPEATFRWDGPIPEGLTVVEAAARIGPYQLPAVWFPYGKAGMSATDVLCDTTEGGFGPFEGQFFVGEFTQSMITRVFLERIGGAYQGAVFRFREGLQCGALRLAWGPDDSLWVGQTNRGWNSLGGRRYGLQRLRPTGEPPFEIREMRATPEGFRLEFTRPVDAATVSTREGVAVESYTYPYHRDYGGDEIERRILETVDLVLDATGRRLSVTLSGLREGYVHELDASAIRSVAGEALLHPRAYYTLNRIPRLAGVGRED